MPTSISRTGTGPTTSVIDAIRGIHRQVASVALRAASEFGFAVAERRDQRADLADVFEAAGLDRSRLGNEAAHFGILWRARPSGAYLPRMPAVIKSVTFDCADALAVAEFWAAALGSDVDEDATSELAYVEAAGWGGPNMWFAKVPEPKVAKNRMHLDLRPPDTMAKEVRRLVALGATVVDEHEGLTVMNDPEGNVFCVELGPAD